MVTDSSGNTLYELGHFPFGESWYNASGDKLQFTTYESDAESGNHYAQAREYVNRLARFSSLDPLPGDISDPQSLNRYSYVRNLPVIFTDPEGTCPPSVKNLDDNFIEGHGSFALARFHDSDLDSGADPDPQAQGTPGGCGWNGGGGGSVTVLGDGGNDITGITGLYGTADSIGAVLYGSAGPGPLPTRQWQADPNHPGDFYNPASYCYTFRGSIQCTTQEGFEEEYGTQSPTGYFLLTFGFSGDPGGQSGGGGWPYGSVRAAIRAIFMNNEDCAELLGGEGNAQRVLGNMTVLQVPAPYAFPTSADQVAYGAVASGNHPAATAWVTGCPTCAGWNGGPFRTYVGDQFSSLAPSMQETIFIHELGHPYTGYGAPMDDSGLYTYQRISELCGTAMSRLP